jgi:hypothetical protein
VQTAVLETFNAQKGGRFFPAHDSRSVPALAKLRSSPCSKEVCEKLKALLMHTQRAGLAILAGSDATASLGTVEEAKAADLALRDADPLADIRNTRKISAAVLGRRYLDRERARKNTITDRAFRRSDATCHPRRRHPQ